MNAHSQDANETHAAPLHDHEEIPVHAGGQRWLVAWRPPDAPPEGRRHGSAGLCVAQAGAATGDTNVVLVTSDGVRWELPAGRPEGEEDWEATLRREVEEEACAVVRTARLLGFSRGRCVEGHEAGLVLVRALWLAEVELQPWNPRFETRARRVVPVRDLLSHLPAERGHWPIYRRALIEAKLL